MLLIKELNPILRGWAEYYRPVTSSKVFSHVGAVVFRQLYAMIRRCYRGLPLRSIVRKTFKTVGNNRWVFYALDEKKREQTLFQMGYVSIVRHSLKPSGNMFVAEDEALNRLRNKTEKPPLELNVRKAKLYTLQKGQCPHCSDSLLNGEILEVNHILAIQDGGKDTTNNLELVHQVCHYKATNLQNQERKTKNRRAKEEED